MSGPEVIFPARKDFEQSLPLESVPRWRVTVSYAYSGWQRTQYELTELGELKEGTTELTAVGSRTLETFANDSNINSPAAGDPTFRQPILMSSLPTRSP